MIAMHLMDGRAVIVLEGTPIALIVPMTLFNFFSIPLKIFLCAGSTAFFLE